MAVDVSIVIPVYNEEGILREAVNELVDGWRGALGDLFTFEVLIAENGSLLAETERFHFDTQMGVMDIDVQRLVSERVKNSSMAPKFIAEESAIQSTNEGLGSIPMARSGQYHQPYPEIESR